MIEASMMGAWRVLEDKLRPFIARRLASPGGGTAGADVDDVMQEVLLRLHRGIGSLRDEERFGPWVYQVARSAIAEHKRSRARHPLAGPQPSEEPALGDGGADDEHEPDAAQLLALVLAPFVAALPSPYREALTLTELEGLTQAEAGAMLGVSHSGMKSRVQRGRQKLRAALEACCHIALDARRRVVACEPRVDGRPPAGCCAEGPPLDQEDIKDERLDLGDKKRAPSIG